MIRLRQIKKSFEDKSGVNEVLRGIDLDVMEGEFISIMGPSGAGKSLLLSILGMYDSAWQGEYYFLDQAIHPLNPKQRGQLNKRYVGFVFQQWEIVGVAASIRKEIGGVTIPTRVIRLDGERTNDVFTILSAGSVLVPDSKFVLPIHVPDWPADWNEIDEAYPPPTFAKQLPWPWKGEHSRWFNAKFDKPGFWSYVV